MRAIDIPVKIDEAWATNATSSFVRPIPDTTVDPNAASFSLGFPPNTFIPEASGGTPPDGRDFNGILQQITQWTRWLNAGAPVEYDSTFSTYVGGYPAGAWLQSTGSVNAWWISQVDNNTSNPDTGGANWLPVSFGKAGSGSPTGSVAGNAPSNGSVAQSLYWDRTGGTGLWICTVTGSTSTAVWAQVNGAGDGPFFCGTTTGSANAQAGQTPAAMVSLIAGMIVSVKAGFTNTSATTLSLNPASGPSFGSFAVRKPSISGPIALSGGEIVTGNAAVFLYDGALLHLLNSALGTGSAANASSGTGIVAAVSGSGSIPSGNFVTFSDSAGTVADSGISPGSINGIGYITLYMQGTLF